MTKLLITGSSGFVGSNLCDHLHKDFDLFSLDISKSEKIPEARLFLWDQMDQLPEVDAIIHLAGKAHDTANTSRSEEYFDINLGLTKKIFDHFLNSDATKFIFFSSVKAVADDVSGVLTENDIPAPKTPYGMSKLAAENYIHSKDVTHDKKVYILRPCMIHGPGNKGNLNLLYKLVKRGIPWPLGAFDNLRSFVSIDNVAFVIRRILEEDINPGTYQLADDEAVSTNELISLMAQTLNLSTRIWPISPALIKFVAKIGDYMHLPLNSERLKKLTESYVVSNVKLKSALSVNKMPVSAKEGLKKTIQSL